MPLPAALAARLSKRGILKVDEPKRVIGDVEEEVFAEDYDDLAAPTPTKPAPEIPQTQPATDEGDTDKQEEEETESECPLVYETTACPNTWNPYHECTDFCKKHWGNKKFLSNEVNERRRNRMIHKYPLPEGWVEIGDPSTSRYYYWNQLTDQVSWLAPLHPKAAFTVAQERLDDLVSGEYGVGMEAEASVDAATTAAGGRDVDPMDVDDDMVDKDFEEIEREVMQERRQKEHQSDRDRARDWARSRDREREKDDGEKDRRKGRSRGRDEELDPMDPASYSDTPRGTWSTGLDRRGAAKTGADVTASGPLFQQRPYPSPGAVLRANKQLTGDSE